MRYSVIALLAFLTICCVLPVKGSGGDVHAAVGAALGYRLAEDDAQAFLIGLASHALLDAIPHYDAEPFAKGVGPLEVEAGLTLILLNDQYRSSGRNSRLLCGAIGGVAPDIEHVVPLTKSGRKIFPSHNGTIKHREINNPTQGIAMNVLLIGVAIYLIDDKTDSVAPGLNLSIKF